jgi:hypothetical protein
MKDKVRAIVMLLISGVCIYYGYSQRHEAQAQRAEVIKLHREMARLKQEAEAARVESSKLRLMLERERENMKQMLNKSSSN